MEFAIQGLLYIIYMDTLITRRGRGEGAGEKPGMGVKRVLVGREQPLRAKKTYVSNQKIGKIAQKMLFLPKNDAFFTQNNERFLKILAMSYQLT